MDNKKGKGHPTYHCSVGQNTPKLRRRHLAEAMSIALAIGFGGSWTPANAASLTCPVEGPATLAPGSTTTNSTKCYIYNGLIIDELTSYGVTANATLVNYGAGADLVNTYYSTLSNKGILNNNQGLLQNYGTLNNQNSMANSGKVTNVGGLHNYGSLTNESGGELINTVANTLDFGVLDNAGTLTNMSGGQVSNRNVLANLAGATLTNYGNLYTVGYVGYGYYSGGLFNAGKLTNAAGAILLNRGALVNYAGATLDNAGTLTNQDGAQGNDATLTNDGTLTNTGTLTGYGILTNAGTLNNAGTLTNLPGNPQLHLPGGTLNNPGVLNNSGELFNQSGATLNNTGTLNNSGSLYNVGNVANSATITNGGTFTVASTASVTGTGTFTQSAGSTTVNGSVAQTSMTINGGRLEGTGSLNVTDSIMIGSNAIVAPGMGPGTVGTLTSVGSIEISGTFNVNLAGLASFDQLNITGATSKVIFDPGSKIHFMLNDGFNPSVGDTFDFLTAAGGVSGLDNLTYSFSGLGSGLSYQVLGLNSDTTLQLDITNAPAAVPLPGGGWLFLSGVIGLASVGRRRGRVAP